MWFNDAELSDYESILHEILRAERIYPVDLGEVERDTRSNPIGLKNIVGVGLGVKVFRGIPQSWPAVCAFVVRKVEREAVPRDFLFESIARRYFGDRLDSDVIEVGMPQGFHHDRQEFRDRIPGGVAIGHFNHVHRGTLGAWLADGQDRFFLTCWHCVDRGEADLTTAGSREVLHPSGHSANAIGRLVASVDPHNAANFGSASTTTVDAALAILEDPDDRGRYADFILGVGEIRNTNSVQNLPTRVKKYGIATHETYGWMVHQSVALVVDHNLTQGKHATSPRTLTYYFRQLGILADHSVSPNGFCTHGDSGAIILDSDNFALGMLVGGSGSHTPAYCIASPIDDVLSWVKQESRRTGLRFLRYPN